MLNIFLFVYSSDYLKRVFFPGPSERKKHLSFTKIPKVSTFHLPPGTDGAAVQFLPCTRAKFPHTLGESPRKTRTVMGVPSWVLCGHLAWQRAPQGHSPATALVRGAMPASCDNFIQLLSSWVPGTQIKRKQSVPRESSRVALGGHCISRAMPASALLAPMPSVLGGCTRAWVRGWQAQGFGKGLWQPGSKLSWAPRGWEPTPACSWLRAHTWLLLPPAPAVSVQGTERKCVSNFSAQHPGHHCLGTVSVPLDIKVFYGNHSPCLTGSTSKSHFSMLSCSLPAWPLKELPCFTAKQGSSGTGSWEIPTTTLWCLISQWSELK